MSFQEPSFLEFIDFLKLFHTVLSNILPSASILFCTPDELEVLSNHATVGKKSDVAYTYFAVSETLLSVKFELKNVFHSFSVGELYVSKFSNKNIYSTPSPSVPSSPQCAQITGFSGNVHSAPESPALLFLDHTHSFLFPSSSAIPCGLSNQVVPSSYSYPFTPALSTDSKKLHLSLYDTVELGKLGIVSLNVYTYSIVLPSSPFLPCSPVILNGADQEITLPFSAKRPEHNQAI